MLDLRRLQTNTSPRLFRNEWSCLLRTRRIPQGSVATPILGTGSWRPRNQQDGTKNDSIDDDVNLGRQARMRDDDI